MMIVHIRKSSLCAAKVLYYGGLAVIVISLPIVILMASRVDHLITKEWLDKRLFFLISPGCMMAAIGGTWKRRLYRCPRCGKFLLGRGRFSQSAPQSCKNCGIKVDFVIDD